MIPLRRRAPRALALPRHGSRSLSSLSSLPHTRQRARAAAAASTASLLAPRTTARYASSSNEDKLGRTFRGQMLESISARMAREKAERERIERERQDSATTKNLAISFMLVFVGAVCYYLGYKMPRELDPDSTLPLSATRAPRHGNGRAELEAAWADFVGIVGKENVSTSADDLAGHATSDFSTHQPDGKSAEAGASGESSAAFCVVYPASTEEVSRVMRVCHTRRIPVTGYSGGTSLEGHCAPTRGGVVVDFARMDRVLALHADDLDAVVQPGVGWEALNEELARDRLFFPPDPGPGARIGGMIGTGCSGTNAYRYGTMRDWVLSLTVVLADGTVIKTRRRPRKSSAGYDLTRLFIGSEGTLGLVTEATLKLAVLPPSTSVAVASFPTVRQAADCVARVVREGVPIAAVEVLDDAQMRVINAVGATPSRRWREAPTLFFKFAGTPAAVREQVGLVRERARAAGAESFDFARDAAEQAELWSARKEALWSTMAARKEGDRVWTGDVAVPISRLPDIIEQTQGDLRATGLVGTIVGHVGDGNFHTILLYGEKERSLAEDFVHRMVKRAVEMEGTVTGEHGVGLVKRDYLPHELGEDTVAAMRKIKQALDPLCLLNPDKVVRMQKPKAGEVAEW